MKNDKHDTNGIEQELLSLKEVVRRTTKSRSALWRDIQAKTFPLPIKIGQRSIAFKSSEIAEWMESRPRVQLNGANGEGK
ncbi:MAG: AlpA family phage regulatory protein [Nitrosomonas sp.]|nr:AlpA family phage regulatory protein [Nitrosomonas sp.]